MATDTEVTLLGMWSSPLPLRVEWALKFKGISYEYIDEDIFNKSQRLLMSNPVYKKVPVLLHGGKSIAESLIILEYIDETWTHNPVLPQDPYERALARFWANFAEEKCWTSICEYFAREGVEQEKSTKEAIDNLRVLEDLLNGKIFFGGECVGYLDIVLGWIAYWTPFMTEITGINLIDETSMPNLEAWFNRFLDLPWVKEILPPRHKLLPHLQGFRKKLIAGLKCN